ncbi:MAG TPA: thiolase family protein [Candidatus Kapabacteria bacterium]|nr:thiolase family protein [Candidatus Kapabacteria bacterium]
MSNTPVIVDALRTPVGKYGGILKDVRADDLAALVIKKVVERAKIPHDIIDDVIFGCANQAGEDNRNIARMAALLAGLPDTIPAVTVNRLCGSSMEAVIQAARAVASGDADCVIAGGVEQMTRAPYVMPKNASGGALFGNLTAYDTALGWRFPNPVMQKMFPLESMGETAENVAEQWKITREAQDAFALRSHQRAIAAQKENKYADEIIPVELPQKKGDPIIINKDEGPRADTSLEKLAALKPAFRAGGTVTAGNSSSLNDGAAAMVVMSEKKAKELGLKPLARFVSSGVSGVSPRIMGIGPVPASRRALQKAGLKISDIGLVELNEAFASQSLACVRDLGLNEDILNVNGGAISIGHPLGRSGARLAGGLIYEMHRRGVKYGLATMCIGVGQGIAGIFELL